MIRTLQTCYHTGKREGFGQLKDYTDNGSEFSVLSLNCRMDGYHLIFKSLMTSTQNYKGKSAKGLQPWEQAHLKSLTQALGKAAEAEAPLTQ